MKRLVFLVMVGVTVAYLFIGAVVFHFLEGTYETEAKRSFIINHKKFLEEHPTCIPHEQLHKFVLEVLESQAQGVQVAAIIEMDNGTGNVTVEQEMDESITNWDIPSCILFCLTVMSTIGYGNLSPKTWKGQAFCIFYALTSIPMFATVLVGVGERLSRIIDRIRMMRPWIKSNEVWDSRLKSIIICATGFSVICFIPSLAFSLTQDWSYLEALYYSVITLTTIGFGDLIPEPGKTKRHNVYRIVLALWILLGLSWVALILSELSTFFQSKITTAASETQMKLSKLEDTVKKRAIETKNKIIRRISPQDKEEESTDKEKDKEKEKGNHFDDTQSSEYILDEVSEIDKVPDTTKKYEVNEDEEIKVGDIDSTIISKGIKSENNV